MHYIYTKHALVHVILFIISSRIEVLSKEASDLCTNGHLTWKQYFLLGKKMLIFSK